MAEAYLELTDGTVFKGKGFGAPVSRSGLVVRNTGMLGHPQSLTHPTFHGQLVVLSYPTVANNGVPSDVLDLNKLKKHFESDKIHAAGLIMFSVYHGFTHWNSTRSLDEWLRDHGVPGLYDIDTRALCKKLREGEMMGKIVFSGQDVPFANPKLNLVAEVSNPSIRDFRPVHFNRRTASRILAIDCGLSNTMIRLLLTYNIHLRVVPWNHDIFKEQWGGLLISSGPGGPEGLEVTIANIKRAIELEPAKPILGIGMGCHLLAKAAGGQTKEMKVGKRTYTTPVMDTRTGKYYVAHANHSHCLDEKFLSDVWLPLLHNPNDNLCEGILHVSKPFYGVLINPSEFARGSTTENILSQYMDAVAGNAAIVHTLPVIRAKQFHTVLILGSGATTIGQAGEYDYFGCHCIQALNESQIRTILINPNMATSQTSNGMADETYFVPLQPKFVEDVIKKERPDGIVLTVGGHTAIECGRQLKASGVLDQYNIEVMGTPIESIEMVENREEFAKQLHNLGEKHVPCKIVNTVQEAVLAAETYGYPVIVRRYEGNRAQSQQVNPHHHHTSVTHETELQELATTALNNGEKLFIEKSLQGFKEVVYEVMRDSMDNCISVADMENFDPLGVHISDAIVVIPSQTLSSDIMVLMQNASLKLARHLKVVGSCTVRFALNPGSFEYYVASVLPRLSRTSALASKVTGYPMAHVAAKLTLGQALTDLTNPITGKNAFFEPSMDYVAVKVPCWSQSGLRRAATSVGTYIGELTSVGEVIGIGVRFGEALQKAVRMANSHLEGLHNAPDLFVDPRRTYASEEAGKEGLCLALEEALNNPTGYRIFAVYAAVTLGWSLDRIYDHTKIDRWFLLRLQWLEKQLQSVRDCTLATLTPEILGNAKAFGCSDLGICQLLNEKAAPCPETIRQLRLKHGIVPKARQIDTCGSEYPAVKDYLYMTYNSTEHDVEFPGDVLIVTGSGSYTIGAGVEHDWTVAQCLNTAQAQGFKTVLVNSNPQAVTTDFLREGRIYLDEISIERIRDIADCENPHGVINLVTGHAAELSIALGKAGYPVLGTPWQSIEACRNTQACDEIFAGLEIQRPKAKSARSVKETLEFAAEYEYPCLVRPSKTIAKRYEVKVCFDEDDLKKYLEQCFVSEEYPVRVSQFFPHTRELQVDAVAKDGVLINYAIAQSVENAGVHSGDAHLMCPAQTLYAGTMRGVQKICMTTAKALNVTGLFKMHLLENERTMDLYVSGVNVRAGRTLPFVSKAMNIDFVDTATKAMLGLPAPAQYVNIYELEYVAIKRPIFSFDRLKGLDPAIGIQMASTGEVACFGEDPYEAFIHTILASEFSIPKPGSNILLSTGTLPRKQYLLESVQALDKMGYKLFATEGTYDYYKTHDVNITFLDRDQKPGQPSIIDMIKSKHFALVVNVPRNEDLGHSYDVRRAAADNGVFLITNHHVAQLFAQSLLRVKGQDTVSGYQTRSWKEYLNSQFLFDTSNQGEPLE